MPDPKIVQFQVVIDHENSIFEIYVLTDKGQIFKNFIDESGHWEHITNKPLPGFDSREQAYEKGVQDGMSRAASRPGFGDMGG